MIVGTFSGSLLVLRPQPANESERLNHFEIIVESGIQVSVVSSLFRSGPSVQLITISSLYLRDYSARRMPAENSDFRQIREPVPS